MNKKKKKVSMNKGKIFHHAIKQEEINADILSEMIEKYNRLEKGYKKFLNDFKILLGFNILQIIMFILMFVNMHNAIIFRTTFIGFVLTIIMSMFVYFVVATRIK